MSAQDHSQDMGASPTRINNPQLRVEAARALVWITVIGLFALAVYVSHSLLVIFGALVFAAIIDGAARLLGRVMPLARGWRIALVILAGVAFFVWLGLFAGAQISREAAQFPAIISQQLAITLEFLRSQGLAVGTADIQAMASQVANGAGAIGRAIGGLFGGLTSALLIMIIGIYVAIEPRLYERSIAWMLPRGMREEFHNTASAMGYTMRRLMFGRLVGMAFEGILTYLLLMAYGLITGEAIPMAALLAILTGLLAFLPNIGAVISGVLMVLVGFSGGAQMGIYTIVVYLLVQNFDGYVIVPMIARKTVDLAPALVLGFQFIMGILFGILGLFLADPVLAMIKVVLERRAQRNGSSDSGSNTGTGAGKSFDDQEKEFA